MIAFLEGILAEKQLTRAALNVGGVGYEVFIPLSSYDRLPGENQPCRLLTYDHVREDDHQLFGFVSEGERQMFVLLMSVSGIGPKTALATLSGMSVGELKAAIAGGDVKRLSAISGIGKKTAERIVVDLRDKISKGEALEAVSGAPAVQPEDVKSRDAILALISLGYKKAEAQDMVKRVLDAGDDAAKMYVEDIIRKALAT